MVRLSCVRKGIELMNRGIHYYDKRHLYLNKEQLSIFLLTFFIMFITDALVFEINVNSNIIAIKRYGVIIVAVIMAIHHASLKGKISIHLMLLTIFPLMSSFLAGYFLNGFYYYSFIAGIWIAVLYSYRYSLDDFAETFCKIMRIVCIASFLCFLFRDALVNVSFFPIISSVKGNSYRWLGVISIPLKIHQRGRNFGPYWEPGTYQIYINVALFLSLFVLKKNNKAIDALIFTITGFSTLSGSVLIPMLLIYAAYALDNRNMKTFAGILVIAVIFEVLVNAGIFDNTFAKLAGTDQNNSLLHRWIGLEGGLRGFIHNPIFGSPPSYNDAIRTQLAWKYLSSDYASSANTFANVLGYFGIYVGGYLLFSCYRMFSSIGKGKLVTILLFLAFVIATSNENLTTSTFFLTLCMLRSANYKDISNSGERGLIDEQV